MAQREEPDCDYLQETKHYYYVRHHIHCVLTAIDDSRAEVMPAS